MSRDAVRQDERQIEENQRHLVGEIVHAVHNEAQTVGLEAGDRFDHENRGVERGGSGKRSAIMGHGEVVLHISAGFAKPGMRSYPLQSLRSR
jgi:hypothetical protein